MYNTEMVTPAPTRGRTRSTRTRRTPGKVTAYDSPIYIADAALYLMATQPDLGIKNPYALDQKQFDAAIELLEAAEAARRRVLVGLHSSRSQAFKTGTTRCSAPRWQVIVNLAQAEGAQVEAVKPKEGATGWSDTWMVAQGPKNINCAYMWLD